jgi:hypothetical protein
MENVFRLKKNNALREINKDIHVEKKMYKIIKSSLRKLSIDVIKDYEILDMEITKVKDYPTYEGINIYIHEAFGLYATEEQLLRITWFTRYDKDVTSVFVNMYVHSVKDNQTYRYDHIIHLDELIGRGLFGYMLNKNSFLRILNNHLKYMREDIDVSLNTLLKE